MIQPLRSTKESEKRTLIAIAPSSLPGAPRFEYLIAFLAMCAVAIIALLVEPAPPAASTSTALPADTAWMLTASALVLLMTPGLSFFYGGMVGRKNVISTMLQSFIAMGVVSLLWVVCGFSLAFGDSLGGIIGNPLSFFMFQHVGGDTHPELSPTIPLALFAVFQMKFAIITPALVTGSFAERVRFSSYVLFICLFTVFIYAPLAHWTWHPQGFLRAWGILDFAGGTVVHMSAGMAALVGAMFLGHRQGYSSSEQHQPAHIPYVILGTGMLWFGWFGFNAGSALGANEIAVRAFLTTNTASASAMVTWLLLDGVRGRRPSALGACIAAVVGLVAITPAAGFVSVGSSIVIGFLAALCCNIAISWQAKSGLDDTLDVFPCHGVGAIVGMILTAVFAEKDGVITGNYTLLLNHLLGLGVVLAYVSIGSYILYRLVDSVISLRVTPEQETIGLDLSQHGESIE